MKKPIFWIAGAALVAAIALGFLCSTQGSASKASRPSSSSSETPARSAFGVVTAPMPVFLPPALAELPDAQNRRTFVAAPWGSGRGDLGRTRPQEANPEAPMSFGVTRQGGMVALDQVNRRLVWFDKDGNHERDIQTTQKAPQDLVVAADGKVAVLDRLADKSVEILDSNGKPIGKLPLEGPGIPEGGGVTGVFVDGKDVYAEYEHGRVFLLGSTDGVPASERTDLPGRPSRDGKLILSAGIVDPLEGRMWVSATDRSTMDHRFTRELRMPMPILRILLLDSDLKGIIYVASHLGDDTLDGHTGVQLVCLEPQQGEPVGRTFIPVPDEPEEIFKSMVALDDGGVMIAVPSENGIEYRVYPCEP
jgi:hypothetical protein